jgi:flagellar biosynthesis protein FlhF
MRIKRFTAPDMRSALRMVREEQGPDAVILSNRAIADGIEVVAATDYDESLVTQALRAAAPDLAAVTAAPLPTPTPTPTPQWTGVVEAPGLETTPRTAPLQVEAAAPVAVAATGRLASTATSTSLALAEAHAGTRESLLSRARAIFRIGDDAASTDDSPTLAELTAAAQHATTAAPARPVAIAGRKPASTAPADSEPPAPRFEAMMAAFNAPSTHAAANVPAPAPAVAESIATHVTVAGTSADAGTDVAAGSDADYLLALSGIANPAPTDRVATARDAVPATSLSAISVAGGEPADPAIVAMRRELATMRALMEKQLEQLSLERLRGSPARAAAFEALLGLGCDTALAQAVAANLDPRLPASAVHAPMFDELMRLLPLARSEPIDDGGVIALVGPTGAGKTTTAAKLAARFAERHRARDVALVSIDRERTGAREQLQAHGRRLGITVCDADSSDALGKALHQLVDYPLVLVDTAGYGVRDRALLRQILWLRSSSRMRSLLVLPANAHPHDLGEIVRRYRPAAPAGVVLTKLDESGRLGAALSVLAQQDLPLAYTCSGQQVPTDLDAADATHLVQALENQAMEKQAVDKQALEKPSRAADNPLATEERHALA